MRQFLIMLGAAALVVLVFGLGDEKTSRREVEGVLESSETTRAPLNASLLPMSESTPRPLDPNLKPVRVAGAAGLHAKVKARGVVGDALWEILAITQGYDDLRLVDRRFTFEYHKVLTAWAADPSRVDADLDVILGIFDEVKDRSFRWAISWLLENSHSDRVVDALSLVFERVDQARGIDALAINQTPRSLETLKSYVQTIENPDLRAHARTALVRSRADGISDSLLEVGTDLKADPRERVLAVECLGDVQGDGTAMTAAMKLALGPPILLNGIRDRQVDHPSSDLRSAAVLAVMKHGDQALARKLLNLADEPGADPAFTRMVDLQVAAYQGADLSRVIFQRIATRGRATLGEARYLNATCTRNDVTAIELIQHLGEDAEAQRMLEAARLNAARRE